MENASKALLIAGAILICILLIGVGMMVYNGALDTINSGISKMNQQEKDMFNVSFTNYEGEKISGSNVRALISNVISNNSTNQDVDGKLVSITIDGTNYEAKTDDLQTNEMSAARAKINTGATYSVVLTYSKAGLVESIDITKNQ
jgi:hypothetical protein